MGHTPVGSEPSAETGQARHSLAVVTASLALAAFVALVLTSPWRGSSSTPVEAIEVPSTSSAFFIQTNGPNGAVGLGDWYTSNAIGAGAGHHYATIDIPCGWPVGTPVHIDLFSPEMNQVSGPLAQTEEPNANYDSTQFELYGPAAVVGPGFSSPAPGSGTIQTTYQPGAPGVGEAWVRFATLSPATCGQYVLRSSVLENDPLNPAGEGNDQNGWRFRVGLDDDADPTTAPPANTDDFDGMPGTADELESGLNQITFQQNSGATACQTFFEYVDPGQGSVTFHDFDFDNNGRVRYYAPSEIVDPQGLVGGTAGTISATSATWNVSNLISRGGDVITNPEAGWWSIVTCISSGNQYIEEGQTGVPFYYTQPATPQLAVTKTDGLTTVDPGDPLTYTITISNTASGASAGAATNVVATDTLPSNATFVSCTIALPATGTCGESGGIVTMSLTGALDAGDSAAFTIDVSVDVGASGTVQNDVSVAFEDGIGNTYAPVTASDIDNVNPATATPTASATATPTDTATATPTATDTPVATNTPAPTDTPVATNTPAPTTTPAATNTPAATDTPAATPTPALTNTPDATSTVASTSTSTPATATTITATPDVTSTPANAPTSTPAAAETAISPTSEEASSGEPPASVPEGGTDTVATLPDSGSGQGAPTGDLSYLFGLGLIFAVAGGVALRLTPPPR